MKRNLFLFIILFTFLNVGAEKIVLKKNDKFKIKEMNIDSISIGGKNLVEGGCFCYDQPIKWRKKEGDKFKALLLKHNIYFEFMYTKVNGNNKKAIQYIKHPGTIYKSNNDVKECLSDTFYVVTDELYVKCDLLSREKGYYILRYNGKEHIIQVVDENVLYFKISDYDFVFDEDNTVRLRICRIDIDGNGNKTEKSVTSEFVIVKIEIK